MEVKIESKIGQLKNNEEHIYSFISNCDNFRELASNEKVKNWQSDADSCGFTIDGIGDLKFLIVEKNPFNLVKFSIENPQTENIFLWVQLKAASAGDTRVKLTTKLNVNPMMQMFISKPLKQALDKIVETLEKMY
ncbi:MAG: hypothetical protein LBQ60_09560 [Bacteroidales bacterium]|jgi:hypothetical protein|nr:hypothetical protein [Bacteroidales bacterium]